MTRYKLLLALLALPFFCDATNFKPWFGNEYEFELRAIGLYQNYDSLSIAHRKKFHRKENDGFVTLSAEYPFKRYSGEFEAVVADTRHQKHWRWDCFRITGRYQWMSETCGNLFNLVSGLTFTEAFSRALHDISSFHHGHFDVEATVAIGKKYGDSCSDDFIFRWWTVSGFGGGDVGSPWLRQDAAFEYNYNDKHLFRAFGNSLWGLGRRNLKPHHFKGYGNVNHQSIDLGVRYSYILDCRGTLSIEYARRVYARNFPEQTNLALLEYYFPFGYQPSTSY